MKKLLFILLLAVLPMLAAQEFQSYTADVNGDSVRIRTGAGLAHPPIHVLEKGEKLTVVKIKEGWAIVQLPANAPCWISAKFAKLSDDGKTYTVTGKRVNLRASANTKFFPVGQAEKDQVLKVCVDGRTGASIKEGDFVRVIPPANATGAIARKFLTKVEDVDASEIVKAEIPAEPEADVEAKGEEVPAEVKKEEKPKREPTPAELEDERKTFIELENILRDELKKDAADVRLSAIRRMFEQFTNYALSNDIQNQAKSYIGKIDATEKLIAAEKKKLAEAEAIKQARLKKAAEDAANAGNEKEVEVTGEYTAIGKLGSHGKNTKSPASHSLFDEEGEVMYDLRWDKGDLKKLLGSKVGVIGVIKEYKNWPNKVIVITRIDVLDDEEEK